MFRIRKNGKSSWKYETSAGSSVSVGPASAATGTIWLTNPTGGKYSFNFVSAEGGVSVGSPVNLAYTTPESYSAGDIWILDKFRGNELTAHDFEGFCLITDATIGVGLGASGTVMLLGIPWTSMPFELLKLFMPGAGNQTVIELMLAQVGWIVAGPLGAYLYYKASPKLIDLLKVDAKALLLMRGFNAGPQLTLGISSGLGRVWIGEDADWSKVISLQIPNHLEPVPTKSWSTSQDDSLIRIPGDLLFAFNDDFIRPLAHAELEKIAAIIQARSPRLVSVEGHTDSYGTPQYNIGLSQRRANAVALWLRSRKGLEARKFQTKAWGLSMPIAPNDIEVNRKKNRRVEIILIF